VAILPNPAILEAIGRGRAGRGAWDPDAWIQLRALALSIATQGRKRRRISAALHVPITDVTWILAEACDAVLQSQMKISEADAVCSAKWERWCLHRDRHDACKRIRRVSPTRVPHVTPDDAQSVASRTPSTSGRRRLAT
jgi:hypothetical protein